MSDLWNAPRIEALDVFFPESGREGFLQKKALPLKIVIKDCHQTSPKVKTLFKACHQTSPKVLLK